MRHLLKRPHHLFARVIVFDKARAGAFRSRSPKQTIEETELADVRAVMDAASSDCAAIYGWSEGGPMCLMFARHLSGPGPLRLILFWAPLHRLRIEPWAVTA